MNNAQSNLLGRFWNKLYIAYRQSLCCFLLQALDNAWQNSFCCVTVSRLLGAEPAYRSSHLHQWLTKLNIWLNKSKTAVCNALAGSFLCRTMRRVYQSFERSSICGRLFRRGGTAVLLALVGCYVIWDWLLRDILTVPVLSSLWDELLLVVSIFWLLLQRTAKSPRLPANTTPMDMPVLFFLVICLILLLLQWQDPGINIAGLRATSQYIFWFFIVSRLIRNDEDCLQLYILMVLIATVIGIYGIYQYIIGAPMPESWIDQAEASVRTRIYSIFSSCNIMGDYMLLFAPMAAGLAYAAQKFWLKVISWGCVGIMCLACLLTMSRGAWVALIIAIVIFALLVDLRLFVLMAFASVVAISLPFVQSRIGYMFTDAYAESVRRGGRSIRWETAIGYMLDHDPLLGMGHGMFGGAIAMQNQPDSRLDYFYTDNYYVKVLTETGFVGLLGYLVMMLSLLWTSLKAWFCNQQKKSRMSPLCAGMLSGMTGVLVHCYFENIFEEPYMMATFWTIAAMTMYLGFLRPDQQSE